MSLWQSWRAFRHRKQADALLEMTGLPRDETVVVINPDEDDDAQAARDKDGQALMHLVAQSQHQDATMCLVKMLIATHHDSRWLQRTWQANITQCTDNLFDAPAPFGDETLKQVMLDAWKMTSQEYTRLIDEAVKQHFPDEDA